MATTTPITMNFHHRTHNLIPYSFTLLHLPFALVSLNLNIFTLLLSINLLSFYLSIWSELALFKVYGDLLWHSSCTVSVHCVVRVTANKWKCLQKYETKLETICSFSFVRYFQYKRAKFPLFSVPRHSFSFVFCFSPLCTKLNLLKRCIVWTDFCCCSIYWFGTKNVFVRLKADEKGQNKKQSKAMENFFPLIQPISVDFRQSLQMEN